MLRWAFHALLGVVAGCTAVLAEDLGDVQRGGEVFRRCTACHRIGPDAENRLGPHLNNILGRQAGGLDSFKYSKAMIEAGENGLVWTRETLDAFLANPAKFLPGGRMSFKGISDPEDRKAVIAYLAAFSPGPGNIPEAPGAVDVQRDPEVSAEILAIEGDPAYGEYLASECVTCHQATGIDKGIPSIVGLPVKDFVTIMHAYKNKVRKNPVMQLIAGRLSNEEIAALAAYFGKREASNQ